MSCGLLPSWGYQCLSRCCCRRRCHFTPLPLRPAAAPQPACWVSALAPIPPVAAATAPTPCPCCLTCSKLAYQPPHAPILLFSQQWPPRRLPVHAAWHRALPQVQHRECGCVRADDGVGGVAGVLVLVGFGTGHPPHGCLLTLAWAAPHSQPCSPSAILLRVCSPPQTLWPPGQTLAGFWLMHCHVGDHINAGMKVGYLGGQAATLPAAPHGRIAAGLPASSAACTLA